MNEQRLVDARFLNSLVSGLGDILFKWDGGVYGIMGYDVGKNLLTEVEKVISFKDNPKEKIISELCRLLVETCRAADSVTVVENKPKECVELRVENCVLRPYSEGELKRSPFFKTMPLCPIKNMVMGVLEEKGENTEMRAFEQQGNQCFLVIGLIEELPMERELREMK